MKILIVGDMSSIRALIKGVLKELGDFTLEEASNGEAALEKLRSGKFDLVISDWNMPVMTGIEMLTAIRQDNDLKNLSVGRGHPRECGGGLPVRDKRIHPQALHSRKAAQRPEAVLET